MQGYEDFWIVRKYVCVSTQNESLGGILAEPIPTRLCKLLFIFEHHEHQLHRGRKAERCHCLLSSENHPPFLQEILQ